MDFRDKAAIQPDVDEDQIERPLSAREQMMEQMGERREAELLGTAVAATPDPAAAATAAAEAAAAAAATADPLVEVIVDGVKQNMPLSQVVRGYQKDSAGSKKLEEAARLTNELATRNAELNEREAQFKKQMEDAGKVDTEEDLGGDDDLVSSLDNLVENGDAAGTAAILRKEIAKALKLATPTMPKEAVAAAVEEKLLADQALRGKERRDADHLEATTKFNEDYADIIADPRALAAANAAFYANLDAGMGIKDAMDTAGKETKEWLTGKGTESARETKLARKTAINNLPHLGARVQAKVDLDNKAQSPSEIIAEMRQRRSLPV